MIGTTGDDHRTRTEREESAAETSKFQRKRLHIKCCTQWLNTSILPMSLLSLLFFSLRGLGDRSYVCMRWNIFAAFDRQDSAEGITWWQSWTPTPWRVRPQLPARICTTAFLCHIKIHVSNTVTNSPDSAWTHSGSMWSVLALTTSGSSDLIFWEMYLRLSRHTGKI